MYQDLEGFINTHGTKTFYEAARFVADIQSAFEDRVRLGAQWLDTERPGWEDQIDLSSLQLASGDHCVCGQLWMGQFQEAMDSYYNSGYEGKKYSDPFEVALEVIEDDGFNAVDLGFNINVYSEWTFTDSGFPEWLWETLTYEWKHRIEKRRAERGTL